MKVKLSLVLTVAVLATAFITPAVAQERYTSVTRLTAGVQPASTATNRNLVIDVRKQKSFTLQMETTTATAGDSTLGFGLSRSVDGVTYDAGAMYLFSATGTNVFITNMPTLGCGYAKLLYTTNATGATNITAWTIKCPINTASQDRQ